MILSLRNILQLDDDVYIIKPTFDSRGSEIEKIHVHSLSNRLSMFTKTNQMYNVQPQRQK